METFAFFCLIFVLYVSTSTSIIAALLFNNRFNLKYMAILPQKKFKLNNWCPFIEQKKQKYLIPSYLYLVLLLFTCVFFILLWILIWKNLWYILPIIATFLILFCLSILNINNFLKSMKVLGICRYQEAFKNILHYLDTLEIKTTQFSSDLNIYKNNQSFDKFNKMIINRNKMFHAKIINARYQNQIVDLFNQYIKNWAYFSELIVNNSPFYQFKYQNDDYSMEQIYEILWKNYFIWLKTWLNNHSNLKNLNYQKTKK